MKFQGNTGETLAIRKCNFSRALESDTDLRDTLFYVKGDSKNVTLSLPEPLLRRFRVYAATRNQSMTSLMTEAIRMLMDQDQQRERAKKRFLDRLREGRNLGTFGTAKWTREELHER